MTETTSGFIRLSFRQSRRTGEWLLNEDPRCPECGTHLEQTNTPDAMVKFPRFEFRHRVEGEGCSLDGQVFWSQPDKRDLRRLHND